jgi:hypothetical protein
LDVCILMIGLMGISGASARNERHISVWHVQLCVDCRKLGDAGSVFLNVPWSGN